ncbi:MAG: cellulose biosynthesis protein BcsS [Rhodopseudomonas palustris]|uniref:Cellulose biosynthesis protein BcsS n=1 Tax=Rhodopseudomonas palustris TaxID=1076 RepID=A0A933VTS7_RHOPL|nr:cellulose biosynthesis protein BcsS [Rhodopseudomonas palustris]
MRCVGWVRAFGVAVVLLAGLLGASAQIDTGPAASPADDPTSDRPGERQPGAPGVPISEPDEFESDEFAPFTRPGKFALWDAEAALLSSLITAPDLAAPLTIDQLSGGSKADPALLFGGFDVWRNGLSAYAGLHWAANGLDDDGLVIRLSMSNGVERYDTPIRTYRTTIFRAALTPGWRFKHGEFELKLFAGLDFESHNLTPDDVQAKWRGPHTGLRVAAEAWVQPLPELMLATSYYATTIASGYGFRAAAGWRWIDAFWLGPEFSGSRDEFSRQTRLGVHVSGLRTDALEWSAAIGMVSDSFGRHGCYARLATQFRP